MPLHPSLPPLDPAALAHGERVAAHLRQLIAAAGGWLSFDNWMAQALYAPGLGYYAAGSLKLAEAAANPGSGAAPGTGARAAAPSGDFVTAPELTPLFGQTVARQVAQVLEATGTVDILEFGAGSGALAASVIETLDANGLNVRYAIVEVSADLKARQRARLSRFGGRVTWLDGVPQRFAGCVLANEVLDAMPVQLLRWGEHGELLQRGVTVSSHGDFEWEDRPADAATRALLAARMPPLPGYVTELNVQAEAWVGGMGDWLERGAALLLDYGFPQREYYHPQRSEGTLMCHLRHHAHANPLVYPGLQDITAHVDFTAMADAALEGGLDVLGYTSQARFLMNAGLMQTLAGLDPQDAVSHARNMGPVQKLLSEAEMGELFKVLAVGRGIDVPLLGFTRGDRRGAL